MDSSKAGAGSIELLPFITQLAEREDLKLPATHLESLTHGLESDISNIIHYTDWSVKSDTVAELKARIRLALNTMQLPISDINYQDKFTDSICEEIIRQGAEQNQEQQARKAEPKSYWFVGAMHKDKDGNKLDKTESFLKEGIWENGYDDKYLDKVKAARSGGVLPN